MSELEKPLVVVPPIRRVPERIERVLVPLDGTEASAAAVRAVIRLAEEQDIEVVVLHVQDEHAIAFSDQPHHETEAWGREFVARWCRCPAGKVQLELRVGLPGEHVVDVARELDVDLIALGWRRNLEPGRAAVVREALGPSEVPVLLIPLTPLSAQDPSVRRLILASASR
jgi:nucleotide-binding universal stress UspA family protein